jgi:plasmid stabilization system protein ParE
MRVTFDPAARSELDRVFEWIAKDNPRAAFEMIARIEAKVMRLGTPGLANLGRPGLVAGTRELLEYPYIVVYKVYEERDEIVIISVVHGARERKHRGTELL